MLSLTWLEEAGSNSQKKLSILVEMPREMLPILLPDQEISDLLLCLVFRVPLFE